jgi:hypothetical protein
MGATVTSDTRLWYLGGKNHHKRKLFDVQGGLLGAGALGLLVYGSPPIDELSKKGRRNENENEKCDGP